MLNEGSYAAPYSLQGFDATELTGMTGGVADQPAGTCAAAMELAEALLAKGDRLGAQRQWRAARGLPDAPAEAWTLAGWHAAGVMSDEDLAGLLREGVARFPNAHVAVSELAKVEGRLGNWPAAEEHWRAFSVLLPDVWWGHAELAMSVAAQERDGDAEDILSAAQITLPTEVRLFIDHARMAQSRRDWPEAQRRWELVVAKFPNNGSAYAGLATTHREQNDMEAERAVLICGIQQAPDSPELLHDLARSAERSGHWADAERHWQAFIRLQPDVWWGHAALAACSVAQNRRSEAEGILLGAMAVLPDEAGLYADFAQIASALQEWHEAERRWQAVVARFPDNANAYLCLANALSAQSELDKAQSVLRRGLAMAPDSHALYEPLAHVAEHRGDWSVAEDAWSAAITRSNAPPSAHLGLASAFAGQGRFGAADEVLRAAIREHPGEMSLYIRAAQLAFSQAMWEEAIAWWEAVKERFPSAHFAPHRLFEARLFADRARAIVGDSRDAVSRRGAIASLGTLSLGRRLISGSVPPEQIVKPQWEPAQMERMAHLRREFPELSSQHTYAAVQFDCMEGNHGKARERLAETVDKNSERYPFDDAMFRDLLLSAILSSQWDVAIRLLHDRYRTDWCSELFVKDDEDGWHSTLWQLDADGKSRFHFDRAFFINPQWIERWADSLDLFYSYTVMPDRESGSVIFSSADFGTRFGLAPSDYRRESFLIPDADFLHTKGYQQTRDAIAATHVPWNQRRATALWRGSAFGPFPRAFGPSVAQWLEMPRIRLCRIARDKTSGTLIDAALTGGLTFPPDVLTEIQRLGLSGSFVARGEFVRHKYQIDIDGVSNAWSGLFSKLLTGSVVLKIQSSPNYRQWYYDDLVAWRNFVPVDEDMGDLVDKIRWLRANDEIAQRIGEEGRQLAQRLTFETELRRGHAVINRALRYFSGCPEVRIPFGFDRPESCYLLDGWSDPLSALPGRFALSPQACIKVPRPASEGDLLLQLDLASVSQESLSPTRMIITVNGTQIADLTIEGPGTQSAWVPASCLARRPFTMIKLLFPRPSRRPSTAQSPVPALNLAFTRCELSNPGSPFEL